MSRADARAGPEPEAPAGEAGRRRLCPRHREERTALRLREGLQLDTGLETSARTTAVNSDKPRGCPGPGRPRPWPCPYLVHQVLLGHLDRVLLGPEAVALIRHLLGHQLLQDEEQQLVVVPAERQVAGKSLRRERR